MRIRFGWRMSAILVGVVALGVVALTKVNLDPKVRASGDLWLQQVDAHKAVVFSKLLGALPETTRKKAAIKLYEENNWQVYRAYPSGHLEVFFTSPNGSISRQDLAAGWRRDTYPLLIMSVPGRLFVVGYDVVRNVPSGRSLTVTQPGFDLYEITPQTKGEPRLIAGGIDLEGGIDSIVYGRVSGEEMTLCAEKRCVDIESNGKIKQWSADNLRDYEFIEVAFGNDSAYALARKKWDDRIEGELNEDYARFFLVKLAPGSASVEPITVDGIPFALTMNDNAPSWKVARSVEGLNDLLQYELARMRNGGLIDFGEHNLEGRIAWNQVYYLNGLISLAEGDLPFANDALKSYARDRVRAEIDLIARLADTDSPGYRVKRYSLDREPLLFALHLGRIANLLVRADNAGLGSFAVTNALSKIKSELLSFDHTVEHPVECQLPGAGHCSTLAYRQGYPFWADGSNVPFNYVSGYVNGLLAVTGDASSLDFAVNLMNPLRVVEKFTSLPEQWRYWAFEGQQGWNFGNGESLNTPDWQGNGAGMDIAHISYRSMDAMALLMLHDRHRSDAGNEEVAHLKRLVSKGMLLPSVNEAFVPDTSPAVLEDVVSRRFSRSSQAWQIQSQVWALSDLASTFKGNKP